MKEGKVKQKIVGRQQEISLLRQYENSGKPEFVAIYGRRRVGKTYLINQLYANVAAFMVSGVVDGDRRSQMTAFVYAMRQVGWVGDVPSTWMDAFCELQKMLATRLHKGGRCILFFDELPCFDTPRSGFVNALSHFWNTWASLHSEVMLIVSGSAATWMITNLIDSHGGLHNRLTHEMHLSPFSLGETEQYIAAQGGCWDRMAVLQLYSVMGGVPYYLSLVDVGQSVAQNMDMLFFSEKAPLRQEYRRLFASLFRSPEPYLKIIDTLVQKGMGLTRAEICEKIGIKDGGRVSQYLENLLRCDFIRYYNTRSRSIKKMQGYYQVTDFFTFFDHYFLRKTITDTDYWQKHIGRPTINTFYGLAFERVCFAHIPQIKRALGVDNIGTEYYAWRWNEDGSKAQIDLVVDRADRITNVCEAKYSTSSYILTKEEDLKIRNRIATFKQNTSLRNGIQTVLITPYSLKENSHSSLFARVITLDDLFV